MRYIRKTITLLMAVVMLVSMLAIPTFAMAESTYLRVKAAVAAFPEVYYLVSGQRTTVLALQAYLMRFNDTCKGKLKYGNTYMDGEYGGRTKNAVACAQSVLGVKADGWCGEDTWRAISESLVRNGDGVYRRYSTHGNCYVVTEGGSGYGSDGFPTLHYLDEDSVPVFIETLI